MKTIALTSLALLLLATSLTSCSKCYECTYMVDIDSDGDGATDSQEEASEDFCTANPDDVSSKEQEGYQCS